MFGYVRPIIDKLDEDDKNRFQSAYCGLCHTLGQRYGVMSRFLLNYDFTFLAMLLSGKEESVCVDFRCGAECFRKRCRMEPTNALALACDESIILSWWKLRDGIADSGFFKSLGYRIISVLYRRSYHKARRLQPEFDDTTKNCLAELGKLEREKCPSIDRTADAFARILSAAAKGENERESSVLSQLLYHIGRWIYLIDAADDLEEDIKKQAYNPLRYRFEIVDGKLSDGDKKDFIATLDHSANLVTAACELLDFGVWTGVINNIVYLGLPNVGSAVMNGQWKKKNRKYDEENI